MPVSEANHLSARSAKQDEARRVFEALAQFCADLNPGDQVPTHTELMRRFGASERMILRALDELKREGRITRRTRTGTFVTDRAQAGALPVRSQMRTIVAIARPDHSFFDRCMEQLSLYTDEADLDLVCRPLRPGREASLTRAALGNPHGFIVFGYSLAPLASQLQNEGARVVLVATPPYGVIPEVANVHGAQGRGGYLAAKHLLELGHQRLAFLQDGLDHSMNPRWHGILKAIREAARAGVHATVIPLSTEEMETWYDAPAKATAWVRQPSAPTGVLAWNDEHAIRLLSTLTLAGVKVPEEISIMGYDALPEGQQSHPPLTTVEQFLNELLGTAVDLLSQPDAPPHPYTATVVPVVLVRKSTAPPPVVTATA